MEVIKSFLTQNDCYNINRTIKVKGLMLHSVGCSQPNASVFIRNYNRPNYEACVHGFIDANTGKVYQTLPWEHRGWHAGGYANNTHIGVEMCEPDCIKYVGGASFYCTNSERAKQQVTTAYTTAVELFAELCKMYNLNPLTDIISHAEGYKLGVASGHADPEHLWKGLNTGYTMDGFRNAVKLAMGTNTPNDEKVASEAKFEPYMVFITATVLNIRGGAGTDYPIRGQIRNGGVYTIVDQQGEWGKLKSGAGWIYLPYTKKL